jgi:hypothetical protein
MNHRDKKMYAAAIAVSLVMNNETSIGEKPVSAWRRMGLRLAVNDRQYVQRKLKITRF